MPVDSSMTRSSDRYGDKGLSKPTTKPQGAGKGAATSDSMKAMEEASKSTAGWNKLPVIK